MRKRSVIFLLLIVDAIVIFLSYLLSFIIRFNFNVEDEYLDSYLGIFYKKVIFIILIKLIVIACFRLYKVVWKFATTNDFLRVIAALLTANVATVAFLEITNTMTLVTLPRGVYFECFIIEIILFVGIRLTYRLVVNRSSLKGEKKIFKKKINVLIIGGGDAAVSIIREIKSNISDKTIVGVLDDNKGLHGRLILGCKVLGKIDTVRIMTKRYHVNEIYIAIPSLSKKRLSEISLEANKTTAKVLTLPSITDLINEKVTTNALKPISVNDLLGREPVDLDIKTISSYLSGKVILITGAGGSIGSEIARICSEFLPRKIILFDNYENSLFEIEQELIQKYDDIEIFSVLGTIRSKVRLNEVFDEFKPHIVFHAGAHKHVPLLEENPREAILNNIIGTKNLVDVSSKFLVEKFILISTDKAVNPSSVMGATKRLAEIIVLEKNNLSSTAFSFVRFGNVLNSNGSVISIFRKNIENNMSLKVMNADIKRYFMTINEAASLVIQAGALVDDENKIFILDMGDPIKILALAENIIKLSGLEPYKDIDIEIQNKLRRGEKLEEELSYKEENLKPSKYKKISIATPLQTKKELAHALERNGETFERVINDYVLNLEPNEMKGWLKKVIPEYTPEFIDENNYKDNLTSKVKDEEIENLTKVLEEEKASKERKKAAENKSSENGAEKSLEKNTEENIAQSIAQSKKEGKEGKKKKRRSKKEKKEESLSENNFGEKNLANDNEDLKENLNKNPEENSNENSKKNTGENTENIDDKNLDWAGSETDRKNEKSKETNNEENTTNTNSTTNTDNLYNETKNADSKANTDNLNNTTNKKISDDTIVNKKNESTKDAIADLFDDEGEEK